VSHELKTPLAVMQNYGTMLQSPDLTNEKRIEYAKGITDNSRRFANLITNILKLNKLENQQIFPVSEQFNLSEQLCQSLLQFEDIWEQKNIEIETEIEDSVDINSDSELLSLFWNNLFTNAFKFTENGGPVSVSLSADDEHATVKISDTGCGISAETGKHIFEKFYQGDTSHAMKGNGLGLALVKRVVDIMNGEIAVESKVGMGSTFTVRLKRGDNIGMEKAD
ncbi:MAG: HAMP domain-containing histidine kinase, partial [Oscillospiraceae bacterium]|nr:HAMP domain-containing histidine kinase [Oscillospiraceae bacterium]